MIYVASIKRISKPGIEEQTNINSEVMNYLSVSNPKQIHPYRLNDL